MGQEVPTGDVDGSNQMASPASSNTHYEEHDSDWQYGPESKRRKQTSTTNASRPSPREIGFMREPQSDGSASFLGSSSGIHFIRHVYNAFARRSADLQQSRARDRSSVPGEDDRLQQGSADRRDTNELWAQNELNSSPTAEFSFDDLVIWTRHYFENWHPLFPCLHAPSILKSMETLSEKGLSSISHTDLIIIRSLVSISLADSRQSDSPQSKIGPVPTALLFKTVPQVMQDILGLLTEPTTICLLQAAFTAQLTLTSILRLNAASRVGGIITRNAFHLGLHRCPGRFVCFSSEEVDMRRRLFWSIYSLERYLSQALGVPLSIRDDDIDVCYPNEERHTTSNVAAPHNSRLKLLSHMAKFSRVRGLILELRNKSILHSHAGTVEASKVNGELSQWWNEVYDDVNPTEDDNEPNVEVDTIDTGLKPYHQLLLLILRNEAIISMNRPLLAAENPNPDFKNALQTCIGSSRSLLAAMKRYMTSTSDAPLTWPSFTWITWMACLILMYASFEGEFPVKTALKYARMGIFVLEGLALRGSSWPETCIEAIKGMESALLSNTPGSQQMNPSLTLGDTTWQRPLVNVQTSPPRENLRHSTRTRNHLGMSPTPTSLGGQKSGLHGSPTSIRPSQAGNSRDDPSRANSTSYVLDQISTPQQSQIQDVDPYGLPVNGPSSEGIIFGNGTIPNTNFYTGSTGQDYFPFSDPSFFLNDLGSIADGPWIIDGNLL